MLELPKGTRDFSVQDKVLREKIINLIKKQCELYGFNPIETPVIEKYNTLAAKFAAGEESDALKEIFKLTDNGKRELGLRFDLTVPFSRFFAMNKGLKIPFKKYQTGEVFRDGPIKTGRYREFTQFDPDIIGVKSVLADAEILSLGDSVFKKTNFNYYFEFNNRKIIDGVLTESKLNSTKWGSFTVSLDKMKKIGKSGVKKELLEKGFENETIDFCLKFLSKEEDNETTLTKLSVLKSKQAVEGLTEIKKIISYLNSFGVISGIFEPALARGLAYYTGPIWEFFLKDSIITSSVAGGGRYDELIGNYLGTNEIIPATGMSFGIETIIEAHKAVNANIKKSVVDLYIIPIKCKEKSLDILQKIREFDIKSDIDLLDRNLSNNLKYANSYGIPFVLIIGEKELKRNKYLLKNMQTGEEKLIELQEIKQFVFSQTV